MLVPMFLLVVSLTGLIVVSAMPGLSDLALLAIACVVASIILLVKTWRRRPGRNRIILDGSNVMYWRGDGPELAAVRDVIESLTARGFAPGVVFDANVGYKLAGRYQNNAELGRLIGLPRDRVMVVPKGVPADQIILEEARDIGARIVTNDRYRDWVAAHPEIRQDGHLVRGGYRAGKLWFDLSEGA